ncbi:KTSC domain-containing protein [Lysobacter sp. TY2-98]|uniref:KTSC domain-containing protein n=1 Tax=Lysobacter sp. TY2-98 TaxID=2290922 RepID=UPI000E209A4E|nr:KTSC domain-containing protein [Lysobacter sp. TY2-98]AXK71838.1 KTSC domain-containing protein [Lysobacter sp. TY2-98]
MQRIPVDSEALSSVGYDPAHRVLEIEFTSGSIYRYFDVPMREALRLFESGSLGHYFSERVRDRYRFEQVH